MENREREIAIQISELKKMYKLGQIGGGTLQGDIQSWWAKIRGKEDPNTKIGIMQRSDGKTFMALNGINLKIYKGEAIGIIGHNGAGKSTLLKLLSRVTAPTEGKIGINGRIASMLEVGTGFNGEMTGRENIYMNGAILGMTKAEVNAKIEQIIEFSEVREFIDTPVKRYSSGMYVKLAFSVAAHLDSEIMIMDEVLAVGDMAFQKKCLKKMRDVATKEGRTVLYVSHNMNTIRQLCSRCVVLNQGKVAFEGDVERAISIYSGGVDNEYCNEIIVSDKMHDPEFPNPDIFFRKIISSNLDGCIKFGETLKLDITIKNLREKEAKPYIRIMLNASDKQTVTMAASSKFINLKEKQEKTVTYEFDVSNIVPGKYTLSFVIYEIGALGVNRNIDVIRDVYSFFIKTVNGFNHDMEWNTRWWGYFSNGFLNERHENN